MDKSIIGITRVTRNGQITLNKKIRNLLGVEIGDYVIFEKTEEENKLFILPAKLEIKKTDDRNTDEYIDKMK